MAKVFPLSQPQMCLMVEFPLLVLSLRNAALETLVGVGLEMQNVPWNVAGKKSETAAKQTG